VEGQAASTAAWKRNVPPSRQRTRQECSRVAQGPGGSASPLFPWVHPSVRIFPHCPALQ
jgi:hypothetical protein